MISHTTSKEAGFTLVEILVTIVLIGATAASLSGMFISIQNIQRQARFADMATRAAQREIEVLRNDSYSALADGQTITFTSQVPATLPGRIGTVVVSQPSDDIRRVDVSVKYTSLGQQRTVTLTSLIGAIGLVE